MDMESGQEIYLKNVTQIGTPGRSGKIYIADEAYLRIHMDEFRDMRVFVLMGHTEGFSGKYTTFIEAAIPVEDISFIRNSPVWTNKAWNHVYQEIRRTYESMIIVGWALDQKGISPKVSGELESIHREHFGGANQVLLLLDTEAQEEVFYFSKNNHLYAKDGFYIYYDVGRNKKRQPDFSLEVIPETKTLSDHSGKTATYSRGFSRKVREENCYTDAENAWDMKASVEKTKQSPPNNEENSAPDAWDGNYHKRHTTEESGGKAPISAREQYRQILESQNGRSRKEKRRGNMTAAAIALVLLAGITWTALKKDPESAARLNEIIETISGNVFGNANEDKEDADYLIHFSTETDNGTEQFQLMDENTADEPQGESENSSANTEMSTETDAASAPGNVIPIEEVDGGIGEAQQAE